MTTESGEDAERQAGADVGVEISPEMVCAALDVIQRCAPDLLDTTDPARLDGMLRQIYAAMCKAKAAPRQGGGPPTERWRLS